MRQMTGIGSTQFDIRLKFCPMVSTCDIMQWYKYHIHSKNDIVTLTKTFVT